MLVRAVIVGALLSLGAVPLVAQDVRDTIGPLEKAAQQGSPENPVPRRTSFVRPAMPDELARIGGRANVSLVATLDATGHVAEIRRIASPVVVVPQGTTADDAARRAAADAVLQSAAAALRQWTYAPPPAPITLLVVYAFAPGTAPVASQTYLPDAAPGPAAPAPARVSAPPANLPWPAAEAAGAVRPLPGSGITPAKPLKSPRPAYSREAMAARIQGRVRLEIVIGTDGKVHDARILESIPLLDEQALDTARQWEFTPGMRNGEAVLTIATLEFEFNLRDAPPRP